MYVFLLFTGIAIFIIFRKRELKTTGSQTKTPKFRTTGIQTEISYEDLDDMHILSSSDGFVFE